MTTLAPLRPVEPEDLGDAGGRCHAVDEWRRALCGAPIAPGARLHLREWDGGRCAWCGRAACPECARLEAAGVSGTANPAATTWSRTTEGGPSVR